MYQQSNSLDKFIVTNFPMKFSAKNPLLRNNARVIYHYTSVDVFEKMLENLKWRMYHDKHHKFASDIL